MVHTKKGRYSKKCIRSYPYSFQGQEHDDEIKGAGNSINYKFRMHDPRLGRFFAVDPITSEYPQLSPYQFSANSPIGLVELEGLQGARPIVNRGGIVRLSNRNQGVTLTRRNVLNRRAPLQNNPILGGMFTGGTMFMVQPPTLLNRATRINNSGRFGPQRQAQNTADLASGQNVAMGLTLTLRGAQPGDQIQVMFNGGVLGQPITVLNTRNPARVTVNTTTLNTNFGVGNIRSNQTFAGQNPNQSFGGANDPLPALGAGGLQSVNFQVIRGAGNTSNLRFGLEFNETIKLTGIQRNPRPRRRGTRTIRASF